ncbi:MAG: hypothetical protein EZS28_013470 [Streblomastix strix]|uniref:Uncharacterized protein n=1 Tax=Streblomastix strix TaxID=222440 RepID=A0A5J4W8E8_9EUKA|nr:MAG: hypothetical protein EZS28_013470 [Streblomastix strix]
MTRAVKGKDGKKSLVIDPINVSTQTGGLTAEEQKYLNVMQYAIDPIRHEEVEDPRISTGRPATTYSYAYIPYNLNDPLLLFGIFEAFLILELQLQAPLLDPLLVLLLAPLCRL